MSDQTGDSPDPGQEREVTGQKGPAGTTEPEGAGKAQATQPISDSDQNKGETQRPAPEDDVGVPDEPGDPGTG